MNKQKKKEKKKKTRERRVKQTILTRRNKLRKEVKYEKGIDREVRANSEKPAPIIKPIVDFSPKPQAEIMSQLEHNLELLKALEEQYLAEEKQREDLNEQLEEEGYGTLDEKLKALREKAEAVAKEEGTEGFIDWTN